MDDHHHPNYHHRTPLLSTPSRQDHQPRNFSSDALISHDAYFRNSPRLSTPRSPNYPDDFSVRSDSASRSSAAAFFGGITKGRQLLTQRSLSAPSAFTDSKYKTPHGALLNGLDSSPKKSDKNMIVRIAILGLVGYAALGVVFFVLMRDDFDGTSTNHVVDALYFSVVTLCTIGYGDIVPTAIPTKLFTTFFILLGFGFVDIVLALLVRYVLDRQESLLLHALDANGRNIMFKTYLVDVTKKRMRIRMKVFLAALVVVFCIALGTVMCHVLEDLSWVDSLYLSVTSVTTVGYGDYSFSTLYGRIFAIVWLLLSSLAVARAFLYLTELRIEKRNRELTKQVLQRDMSPTDLLEADLDKDGWISKSEFVIYKLKEMGKIGEKDILQILDQFNRLDTGNCGKITLSDLMEGPQ